MKTLALLAGIVTLALAGAGHLAAGPSEADCCSSDSLPAACSGKTPCKVCTDCSRCGHCKRGGKCGVCR